MPGDDVIAEPHQQQRGTPCDPARAHHATAPRQALAERIERSVHDVRCQPFDQRMRAAEIHLAILNGQVKTRREGVLISAHGFAQGARRFRQVSPQRTIAGDGRAVGA